MLYGQRNSQLILFIGAGLMIAGIVTWAFQDSPAVIKPLTANYTQPKLQKGVHVLAAQVWTSTGIQINKGDYVTISARGSINLGSPGDGADKWVGPEGWGTIPTFNVGKTPARYTYYTDSLGCLIGRIGENGTFFKVGESASIGAKDSGVLYLGVDDGISDYKGNILPEKELQRQIYDNNRGVLNATVEVR